MSRTGPKLPAAAVDLLPPADRVEARGVPRPLHLTCWAVLAGTALLAALTTRPVDVVVVGNGELVPASPPERVPSLSTQAELKRVLVRVGQVVQPGDQLGELEPVAAADLTALLRQEGALRTQVQSLREQVEDPTAAVPVVGSADSPDRASGLRLAAARRSEFLTGRDHRTSLVGEARTAATAAAQRVKRLEAKVALLKDKESDLAALGVGSKSEKRQAELERVEAELQLADAGDAHTDWEAKLSTRTADLAAYAEGWRRTAAEQLAASERELSNLTRDLARAERTSERVALRCRTAGVVTAVPAVAPGSVLPEGTPLFTIVLLDSPLEVEADLSAADAPRVQPGCEVRVKVDKGFPYPTHGGFVGRVAHVSPHAAPDSGGKGKGGEAVAAYRMSVVVERSEFRIRPGEPPVPFPATVAEGLAIGLRPGAPVVADARVGTRRVYDFLLDPFARVWGESFREP